MAKLSTELAGEHFASCVLNAAGPRDESVENMHAVGDSAAGAIVTKSTTGTKRAGNPEPRWHDAEPGSLNSMGLPNLGHEAYAEVIEELRETYAKPVIASISGFSVEENVNMINSYDAAGADIIEVNVACPNTDKDLVGYNLDATEEGPSELEEALLAYRKATTKPLAIKLPPYFAASQFDRVADIITRTEVDIIVTINTVGQSTDVDIETGETVLAATDGFGGLSGEAVLPIALGNVRHFAKRLGPDFPIVGVGGVTNGEAAYKHLLCGARAVGIATQFMKEGPRVFERVAGELSDVLDRKDYASSDAAVGKLKVRQADS